MSISPFAIVLIISVIWILFTRRGLLNHYLSIITLSLVVEGIVSSGYFVSFGENSISFSDFFQMILLIYSIIVLISIKDKKKYWIVVFVLVVVINILSLALFPLDEYVRRYDSLDKSLLYYSINDIYSYPELGIQTYKTAIRFIVYIINLIAFSLCISIDRWVVIVGKYIKACKVMLAYLGIEFLLRNILHWNGFISIIGWFFGSTNAVTVSSGLVRNGLNVILGFTNEPSQLSMVLTSFVIIYILSNIDENTLTKKNIIIIFSILFSFLCGSFRIVGSLPIILLIYSIKYKRNVGAYAVISALILGVFILGISGNLDYIFTRLSSVIADSRSSVLFKEGRINTIVEGFAVFLKRPLIGCGLGTAFAYGFIPSILQTFGLLGTACWYHIAFNKVADINRTKNGFKYCVLITILWIYTNAISTGYIGTTTLLLFAIKYSDFDYTTLTAEY